MGTTIYKINKDPPYNTGNYIQYLVITYNGKEFEKLYSNVHFVVYLKLTQHYKSTTCQLKNHDLKNIFRKQC